MQQAALVLLIGAMMVAPLTASSDWLKSCQAGATARNMTPGGVVCHNPSAADDDPGLLQIGECENVDVSWFDNISGDGTGDLDGTATIFLCPMVAAASLDTEAERLVGCQPIASGGLSPAAAELFGVGGFILWADIELASVENQLLVRCSQPSGN